MELNGFCTHAPLARRGGNCYSVLLRCLGLRLGEDHPGGVSLKNEKINLLIIWRHPENFGNRQGRRYCSDTIIMRQMVCKTLPSLCRLGLRTEMGREMLTHG